MWQLRCSSQGWVCLQCRLGHLHRWWSVRLPSIWRDAIGWISQGGSRWLVETCCTCNVSVCNILKTCQLMSMQLCQTVHTLPLPVIIITGELQTATSQSDQDTVHISMFTHAAHRRLLRKMTALDVNINTTCVHGIHNSKERMKSNIYKHAL